MLLVFPVFHTAGLVLRSFPNGAGGPRRLSQPGATAARLAGPSFRFQVTLLTGAAHAVGCRGVILGGTPSQWTEESPRPDYRAHDLKDAASWILGVKSEAH